EQGLADLLARFHTRYAVFSGGPPAGNHFNARACIYSNDASCGDAGPLPAMREGVPCPMRIDGLSCIEATARLRGRQWGGWYFLNGVLHDVTHLPPDSVGNGIAPDLNFGSVPDAGVDLTGATELTFDVLGRKGDRMEFFALGVGWNPDTYT